MSEQNSVIVRSRSVLSERSGVAWGFVGVAAFSFTVPFTRVAEQSFSPLFVGSARAVVAALLAAGALWLTRQRVPSRPQLLRLLVVACGVVLGFPLLTAYALTTTPASHGAVVIALLPAATAVAAVLRTHERPYPSFWVFAGLGALATAVFATLQAGGLDHVHWSDLLLFGAVLAAAIGYAEGGLLARDLGAWQTISWALVLCSPIMIALTGLSAVSESPTGGLNQWLAFTYLGCVSMFLGFFAWYRGLAVGPISRVSQVQLVQPVMTILWAWVILNEKITWITVVGGCTVIVCAGMAVRRRRLDQWASGSTRSRMAA